MRQVASQLRSKAIADSLWGFKLLWKHVKIAPKCSHHSKMLHLCKNMDLQSQSATVISHDISQCVTHMHSSLQLSINQEHCLFMAAISQIGLYIIRHPFQFVQCLWQTWQYQSMATIFGATTAAANTLDDPQTLNTITIELEQILKPYFLSILQGRSGSCSREHSAHATCHTIKPIKCNGMSHEMTWHPPLSSNAIYFGHSQLEVQGSSLAQHTALQAMQATMHHIQTLCTFLLLLLRSKLAAQAALVLSAFPLRAGTPRQSAAPLCPAFQMLSCFPCTARLIKPEICQ